MDVLYYFLAVLMLLGGLAQSAMIPHIQVAGVYPDLMLILVVSWSLLRGLREGFIVALMAGLILDMLSGAPFGLFTISLACASVLSGLSVMSPVRSQAAMAMVAVVLSTLCYYAISLFMLYMGGRPVPWLETLVRVVLPSTVMNLAVAVLVFPFVRWLHRKTIQREMEW